jgi:2-keto-4-pentenoate hydratase/2-oxohepta-3-ene-1,7-dioic acid hydratase in catechol pathway
MKWARFKKNGALAYGIVKGSKVKLVQGDPFTSYTHTNQEFSLEDVEILPPCQPSKVVAVGLNYRDHAAELGMSIPDEPILFLKPATSVVGPFQTIIYPNGIKQLDYEAELVLVVGKKAKRVKVKEANNYILGFTCGNDVTARDLQRKDGQWTRSKSFDTFAPIGPFIQSKLDADNLKVELYLNGQLKQTSSTSQMIFKPSFLLSFVSHIMTLLPGDVIMTGTPPGVGPMNPGDVVEVKIEGIGVLKNQVKAES